MKDHENYVIILTNFKSPSVHVLHYSTIQLVGKPTLARRSLSYKRKLGVANYTEEKHRVVMILKIFNIKKY
jgi:hypothetical protein